MREKQKSDFAAHGYLILDRIITSEQVDVLKATFHGILTGSLKSCNGEYELVSALDTDGKTKSELRRVGVLHVGGDTEDDLHFIAGSIQGFGMNVKDIAITTQPKAPVVKKTVHAAGKTI